MSEIKQKRSQILLELFGEQIKQKIETEKLNISEKELFNKFSDYEITESGKYLEWMTKTYIGNGFLYEDLYKVKETLEIFHENKMKLLKDKRDIQQYKTLSELWVEVKNFVEQKEDFLSTNEQKRKEKELAYAETEFLYEDDNLRVVAPLTKEASQWWGKGTRWCTAADKNNMFYEYFNSSSLIIFDFKDGEKWQLWMFGDSIQFMDEDDKNLFREKIVNKWEYIEHIFLKLLEINSLFIKNIPKNFLTYNIVENMVESMISPDTKNKKFYFIQYISKELITDELCKKILTKDGSALLYIPEKNKTDELYKIAVQQNGVALCYIPKELRTKELCEIAVQQNGLVLYNVPHECRTKELYKLAVQQNGNALCYVPENLITKELCEIAVKQNGTALYNVPEKFRTEDLSKMAVSDKGEALKFIAYKLRTRKICEIAVQQNGEMLNYVPEHLITLELCKIAVLQNDEYLEYVPEKFKTKEICELAIDVSKKLDKSLFVDNNLEQYKILFNQINKRNNLSFN